ncbi:MAG: hypothetical protein J6386_01780 [Candidatus Synoicihabitans palmerolidicus]|nr:hypothetical protein [Candidatus Synoicihabitans palmerolidicus]
MLKDIPALLAAQSIEPQIPATETMEGFGHVSRFPPAKGHARLLDGTRIEVSAQNDGAGDVMASTLNINGHEVSYDAVGVIGVLLDGAGHLEALAAGGLKNSNARPSP